MTTDVTDAPETTEEEVFVGNADPEVPDAAPVQPEEGKEGDTSSAPEPEDDIDADLKSAREAAAEAERERARREVEEGFQREVQERQRQAIAQANAQKFRQTYAQRANEAGEEAYQLAIQAGIGEAQAQLKRQAAVQRFNSHHADGLKLYQSEAEAIAQLTVLNTFNDSLTSMLGKDAPKFFGSANEPKGYDSMEQALSALKSIWTEGLLPEKEVEARVQRELLKRKREAEKVSPEGKPTVMNGATPEGLTLEKWRAMGVIERRELPPGVNDRMLALSAQAAAG